MKLKFERIIRINPMGAPRMNRGDLLPWKLASGKARSCVYRYLEYKDVLREKFDDLQIDGDTLIRFYIPCSPSWSKKKKALMHKKPHQLKPDIDNLLKGFFDSVYEKDEHIYSVFAQKFWIDSEVGMITVACGYDIVLQ